MLLISEMLIVLWCEPDLAQRLGGLEVSRPLHDFKHPLVQEIRALLEAGPIESPLVSLAATEPVKIVVLPHGPGFAISLQAFGKLEVTQQLEQTIADFAETQSRQELFIRTLAHDVRSPLATIQMILGRAHQEQIMTGSRFFGLLEENVHHLEDVINSLLGLVELHQNQYPLVQSVSFDLTLQLLERQLDLPLSESGGRIEIDLQVPGLSYVPSWIESMLRNLLVNALKYAHPERQPVVQVSSRALPDGKVLLSVADNGLGFPDGRVPETLFEPFRRYHTGIPGSGLGLYLVRSMVVRNGGAIAVHTFANEGSRFDLTLVPFANLSTYIA